MPALSFISDDDLLGAVKNLILVATKAKAGAKKKFGKNVIDPFATLFEMAGFEFDAAQWMDAELSRQTQKTLQNHIGTFHQQVLGGAPGWKDVKTGGIIDVVSEEFKIIAEIKNKHNTLSGGKLAGLYHELESLVMPKKTLYKGYVAYYVQIIPSKPNRFDECFTPSDREQGERCHANELIRQIDGASFYTKVTGEDDALSKLFATLPSVIETACEEKSGYKFADREFTQAFFKAAFQE